MKVAIGSDHGGFDLKETVRAHLTKKGYEVTDFGTYDKKSCDYPQFGKAVAHAVADGTCEKGIVICTTGIGISIVANKVPGIRAGLCSDVTAAFLTRSHNDANVLAMGAGLIGEYTALDVVDTFLETPFSGEEKHARRIAAIED
ncbi:MAG: ribose 5-phosphate isomerase B [Lachnospiraceae bacterium]|nr:ribose 5-phosphate isomerase B [Lachnospiraceae bacterium]